MKIFFAKEYKALFRLGLPITIGQLGMTAQNLVDNIMVGQHSTEELAAAGFVNNLFVLALLLTIGFSMAAVSQIGASYSQGRTDKIVRLLKGSIVADLLQASVILVALIGLYFVLPLLGQPEELLPLMRPYLLIQILSLPFMVVMGAFRQTTDSINDTSVAMAITLIGNVWNVFFNWVLIYGHLGFAEMGIEGAAWATFSSRVLMLLLFVSIFFLRPKYKKYVECWRSVRILRKDILLLNRLGWIIALQMGMESASFFLVAIVIGWFGTSALAAHQVMLNVANVIFMTYMGIGTAVSIRVSNHNGLGDIRGVRQATFAGYQIILLLTVAISSVAFVLRHDVSLLFTDSKEVADIVSSLAVPLLLYQFGDGMQLTFSNALRGLGDVKKLMKYSFFAYIIVSLPLSYVLGVTFGLHTFGVWMAFPVALTLAGVLYLRYFLSVTRVK